MGTCNGKLTRAVVPCVAGCGGLHMSVLHPTRRAHAADARRRRVSHRAPALRPHRTDQISMRVQRAHNREGKISDLFGPPQIGMGVGPRRALQFCSSSWFGRPRRRWPRRRRPRRRRRSLPPPHWMDAVSVELRATRAHALSGNNVFIHTVRCVGPPRVRLRVRVWTAGRWGRPRVRPHCCSRRQH